MLLRFSRLTIPPPNLTSALPIRYSWRYDPQVARSAENLWLNAFTGLLAFSGVLLGANVTIAVAVTHAHYPFWTNGIMIGSYIAAAFAATCYLGALRQWAMPFAGDRLEGEHSPLSPPAPLTTPGSTEQITPPLPVQPPLPADLAQLGDHQIQVLRVSIVVVQDLQACLADLNRTPRPSVDYDEVCARAQDSVGRTKTQLRTLARHVSVSGAWPHKEWALSFHSAERKVQQHIETWQQPEGTKLADSAADLLRLIAGKYPSLFTHQM